MTGKIQFKDDLPPWKRAERTFHLKELERKKRLNTYRVELPDGLDLSIHGDLYRDHDPTSPHLKGYTCFICKYNFEVIRASEFLKQIGVEIPERDMTIADENARNADWAHRLKELAEREFKLRQAEHKRHSAARRVRWHRAKALGVTREEFEARERASLPA